MRSEEVKARWVSGKEAAHVLGCPPKQVPRLADRGLLTVRRLPGCDPRYLLADVEHLAAQATMTRTTEGRGGGSHEPR